MDWAEQLAESYLNSGTRAEAILNDGTTFLIASSSTSQRWCALRLRWVPCGPALIDVHLDGVDLGLQTVPLVDQAAVVAAIRAADAVFQATRSKIVVSIIGDDASLQVAVPEVFKSDPAVLVNGFSRQQRPPRATT